MCKDYNQDNYSYEEVLELTKQGIEIWRKPITKHYDKHGNFIERRYWECEVSNLGRVRRTSEKARDKEPTFGYLEEGDVYMRVSLYYTDENGDRKYKAPLVHRLVAFAFIPNPDNKPQVDHILPAEINNINNRVDNLRWSTGKENMGNPNTRKNLREARRSRPLKNSTYEEKYPCVTEEDILVEEWKDITGYEGKYMISNMGRVRNKKRLLRPRITKNEKGEDRYQEISLRDKDGKHTFLIHRLVAEHFIDNPENKPYVDHISTNGMDNRYFNLKWSTHKENMGNPNTRKNMSRLVIVLDRKGNIISIGLGIGETAKKIGISEKTLSELLKSCKPYRAGVTSSSTDLLRSLNGMRTYYLDQYNETEAMREIAEDKADYSYCYGDLVCIYPDGRITEPMSGKKLAKVMGINYGTVYKIRDSKKPYKVSSYCRASKEHLEHLKTLEGIRIMYYEDYLAEQELAKQEPTIEEVNKKYNQTDFFDDYKLYLNF